MAAAANAAGPAGGEKMLIASQKIVVFTHRPARKDTGARLLNSCMRFGTFNSGNLVL
jgi:hypothetical protein